MRATDRTEIAIVLSVVLATLTIRPLTVDGTFFPVAWLLIGLIGLAGALLRRARLDGGVVLGAQTALLVLFSLAYSLTMPSPGRQELSWFQHYPALWSAGIEHMRTQASPMDPNDGVKLIFVTVIGLIMVMTDLLAAGIRRPAWAIAPPATLFLVPALGLGFDTGILSFCFIALGYLGILVAEGLNSTARWTRGLSRDSAEGFGTAMPVVWRAALSLGVPAVVLAVVLGLALPTLSLPGLGIGPGAGNGPLQLTDPTLDIRRNLNQPANRVVIQYQTDGPGGVYLRMATLPQLSAAGWGNVQIRLSSGNRLPAVPGLGHEPPTIRHTSVQVLDFGSQYLPLPYAPRAFAADGDWRFDPNSLVVINGTNKADGLRNLSYTVDSMDVEPTGEELADATSGSPSDSDITAQIPPQLPASIVKLAKDVTADAATPAAKAAAIQAFLRSSRFTYSTEREPGSGYVALTNFLLVDRKGYCEQFAAAMAAMARVVGIPSRVSVGFLPGEREGDTWKVSIRDMHAWPELYFAGYGWVRYEPTPAVVTGAAPPWTVQTSSSSGPEPSVSASRRPTEQNNTDSQAPSDAPSASTAPNSDQSSGSVRRTLIGSGIGLVALLVLATPATVRIWRRSGRLGGVGSADERVEGAWAEIRDSVLDYGGSWPDGSSPRSIGREVATRLDGPESETMGRVATLVERSRYARTFADPSVAELPEMTSQIRKGLAEPIVWWRRVGAVLLPRSLFRRRGRHE